MQDLINEIMDINKPTQQTVASTLEQSLSLMCEIALLDTDINPLILANIRMCHSLAMQLKA